MPLQLESVLFCDDIITEKQGDAEKISLIGLWDYLSAAAFPARFRFAVFYQWREVEGEQLQELPREAYVRLYGPVGVGRGGGDDPGQMAFDLLSTKARVVVNPFVGVYRHRAYFEVDFPVSGKYQLEFYFDDVLAHTVSFSVVPEGT